MLCSRPPRVAAEGRRNPFTSPLLVACCSRGLPYLRPVRGGHGQRCCLPPRAHAAPALALSPPAAVWQRQSRTHGASAAGHPRATDRQPSEAPGPQPGLLGKHSQKQEQQELRQPQARAPSRAISGSSVYSATAWVFNQINFYHNQSDWSVESKRAFPSH